MGARIIFILVVSPILDDPEILANMCFLFSALTTMRRHLRTVYQEELNDLVGELTIVNAKIQYLLACKELTFRERIELGALMIKRKKLIKKLAPFLEYFKTIPPNIMKLL